MLTKLKLPVSILLTFLLILATSSASPTLYDQNLGSPIQASSLRDVPVELINAILAASAQPFEAVHGDYRARASGMEFTISIDPLIYLEQKIIAPSEEYDSFGYEVALDGDTALVGVIYDTIDGKTNQGSAYVFTRNESSWTLQQILTASDGMAEDYFGWSVALSKDTALVGALRGDGTIIDQGSAYVFVRSGKSWSQQAKITAPDGSFDYNFGVSMALLRDLALIGSSGSEISGKFNQGAAYIFTRSGTTWSETRKLIASDGEAGDEFGSAVAIDGNTALVSSPMDDIGLIDNQGSAYVFVDNGITWNQQAKLIASDGGELDIFGGSVALCGDTALVGAFRDDVGMNTDQGSVYFFRRTGTSWSPDQKLLASHGEAEEHFGSSVAISGTPDGKVTALVGVSHENIGTNNEQGSAYVFAHSFTGWSVQAYLTAPDGAAYDQFGFSVAIDGDTALASSLRDSIGPYTLQGSTYVFTRSGSIWGFQSKLVGSEDAAFDYFGYSVDLDKTSEGVETALVGSYMDDIGSHIDQGSAYIFIRNGAIWELQQKLTASDGETGDKFGISVALDGDFALVGAAYDDVDAKANQGSAYVFARSGTTWSEQARLNGSDSAANDQFGQSLALSGETALVGAPVHAVSLAFGQGSAYIFTRSGAIWGEQAELTAEDGAVGDQFGSAVELVTDTALIGAGYDDIDGNTNQGSAYVFSRGPLNWTQNAKLIVADGAANDSFGLSLDLWRDKISGDFTVLVGACYDDIGANSDQGSAYIFSSATTHWIEQQKLVAPDGAANDLFGCSVAIDVGTALVGAYGDDIGINNEQGSAYIFVRSGTLWNEQTNLSASDGTAMDWFGGSVALFGRIALVGAPQDDINPHVDQGSAYVYQLLYPIFLPVVIQSTP